MLKRFALLSVMFVAVLAAFAVSSPRAQAGLFSKGSATPSPSPSPSALPTATPEPPDVAIPRLQARLKANPNDQDAMAQLASQFLGINRPDLAGQLTQHLLQMGDKNAQVYYLDGFAMNALGHLDAAINDLESASTIDPTNVAVLGQLADFYLKANRFTDAERIANRGLKLNPDEESSFTTAGSVYAAEQKYDEARAYFEKAASMAPKDSGPIFQIATTYSEQNNIPAALESIQRALALNPQDVQALVFKADLYAKQHDDAHTAAAYDDAAVAATDDQERAVIMVRKAAYFAAEKKNSQAEGVFQQAIAQYPKESSIHVAFGDYWMAQKNVTSAVSEYQLALKVDGGNGDALGRMAQLSMHDGKWTDAVGYLKQLIAVAPDPQAYAMLGQAYSFQHDYVNSKDACTKSFNLQRDPSTLGCIAGADFEMKNYKEAGQIFDVLDANAHGFLDQNPQLLYVAARSYQQLKQNDKAVSAYKRLLPMVKKGTKDYSNVVNTINQLSKPQPKAKTGKPTQH